MKRFLEGVDLHVNADLFGKRILFGRSELGTPVFYWIRATFSGVSGNPLHFVRRNASSVCGFIAHAAFTRTTLGADGGSYSNPFVASFHSFSSPARFPLFQVRVRPRAGRSVGVLFDPLTLRRRGERQK